VTATLLLALTARSRAHAGPFIRVRVGDILDFTLLNKDDTGMAHNVSAGAMWLSCSALGAATSCLLLQCNRVLVE
jgi:hypothetical protein